MTDSWADASEVPLLLVKKEWINDGMRSLIQIINKIQVFVSLPINKP